MTQTQEPGLLAGETLFTLDNQNGLRIVMSNFGACLRSVQFRGKELALGLAPGQDPHVNPSYLGVSVGRFANRIRNATFTLGDQKHTVVANLGAHQVHGGPQGFDKRLWDHEPWTGEWNGREVTGLAFSLLSPHGDQGFPGELQIRLVAAISHDNQILLQYRGKATSQTLCNPCNHAYWNLDGLDVASTIDSHTLALNAMGYFPVDSDGIPLGAFFYDSGARTRLDKKIDHCYLLDWAGPTLPFSLEENATRLRLAARLVGQKAELTVYTDLPGLQVYTGDFLKGVCSTGTLRPRQGVALETQIFPDSPNQFETYREQGRNHGWPEMDLATWNAVLAPGIERRYTTVFALEYP